VSRHATYAKCRAPVLRYAMAHAHYSGRTMVAPY
jgi:hypothetical protein